MSNYVNLNTECNTSEPRQNIGIGQKRNRYEAQIWYYSPKCPIDQDYPDKCVAIYFDYLSVWDRDTQRMLTLDMAGTEIDGIKHVVYLRPKS